MKKLTTGVSSFDEIACEIQEKKCLIIKLLASQQIPPITMPQTVTMPKKTKILSRCPALSLGCFFHSGWSSPSNSFSNTIVSSS